MSRASHLRFPHHTLSGSELPGPYEIVPRTEAPIEGKNDSAGFSDTAMRLSNHGVRAILLIHGTFAGNDIAGLLREIARFSPVSAHRIRELAKRWLDDFVGEIGNYTEGYAESLAKQLSEAGCPIPVHCFAWSGENHHLGRADAVMSLVEKIDSVCPEGGDSNRVLIWAHSHGGNVVAMLSQIVGADRPELETFFDQTRLHYHSPTFDRVDLSAWQRVKDRLFDGGHLPALDVATFGTPLRYRWNREICPKLLHFVQHRVVDAEHPAKAVLPRSPQDVYHATAGDYVQHIGIGGTDFLPSIFAWRDWLVERRMARIFESTARRRDIWKKLKIGRRASCDGTTLLVDYSIEDNPWYSKLFGHGVYTMHQWLPFHLREVTERFYD